MADFIFTLCPDTQKISHTWKTSIQTTVKGAEKRSALFTWPRIKLSNSFVLNIPKTINYLKRNLYRYADAVWGVPVWTDKTVLTSQAASGQKIINVQQTDYRHFYSGRSFILVNPADTSIYEIGTIDILTSAQITALTNLTNTWPAGSLALPLYDCRVSPQEEISASSLRNQTFDLEANEAFESLRAFSYTLPISGAPTYQGLDLFLGTINYPITYGFKRPYDLTQFLGLGYSYANFNAGDNSLSLKTSLTRSSRQSIWELFGFFDSKQGRFQGFWIPTWSRDIVATAAIDSSDTVLTIENIEYSTVYLPNEIIGRHVFIKFPDGTYACRKISDADSETITLDSAIGVDVPLDALPKLMISFLMFCRFDIDELEIDYVKENFGKADLSFAGLIGEDL